MTNDWSHHLLNVKTEVRKLQDHLNDRKAGDALDALVVIAAEVRAMQVLLMVKK